MTVTVKSVFEARRALSEGVTHARACQRAGITDKVLHCLKHFCQGLPATATARRCRRADMLPSAWDVNLYCRSLRQWRRWVRPDRPADRRLAR